MVFDPHNSHSHSMELLQYNPLRIGYISPYNIVYTSANLTQMALSWETAANVGALLCWYNLLK